jgi:sigma-B regulation protein RsbU (phosphoserine phosphatase)
VQAGLLETLIPPSQLFERLRSGIDFLVPIPAFSFFDAAGLLHRRGKVLGSVLGILLGSLAVATFAFGPSHSYHVINDVVVIAALVLLVIQSLLNRGPQSGLCRGPSRLAHFRGIRPVGT